MSINMLNKETLVMGARRYKARYGRVMSSELGGVPLSLACVIGYLYSQDSEDIWPIPDTLRKQLGVYPGMPDRVQLWAGLRFLNESQIKVFSDFPEDRALFWPAVLWSHAIGHHIFTNLVLNYGGIKQLLSFELPENYQYIIGSGISKVEAAQELGGLPTPRTGILTTAPDDRLRRKVGKGALGAWVAGAIGFVGAQYYGDRGES